MTISPGDSSIESWLKIHFCYTSWFLHQAYHHYVLEYVINCVCLTPSHQCVIMTQR
jgi:hypothetical protein